MRVREKPPLRLSIEAETPSGKRFRWAEDEPDPANVPAGLRFSSTVPGGFESCDCTLPRKPGLAYSDLERLTTLRVTGAGGEVVSETRLERAPRTSGDQMSVSPSASGWQAALEDNQACQVIYRDIDLSHWSGPSTQRKLDFMGIGYNPQDASSAPDATTGLPSLETGFDGTWALGGYPVTEGLYDGGGASIGSLGYSWKKSATVGPGANDHWFAFVGSDDTFVSFDTTADLVSAGPGSGMLTATTPRKFAAVAYYIDAAGGTDGKHYAIFWNLAVYGDHGLENRGGGFYASDVIQHAVSAFCPSLTSSSETIQPSGFLIENLAFTDPTTAAEIVKQAGRFHPDYDWAVWKDRTFWYYRRGTVGKRWRARINPAQLQETGPQIDRLFNEVLVTGQDVDGSTRLTVGPPGSGAKVEDTLLSDTDPTNPLNEAGTTRRALLDVGTATVAEMTQVGSMFLQEQKVLDTSGQAQLVGHVEDDHGVLFPASEVRAGDYISFVDSSSAGERRIVKADYDHSSRTCSIDLDSPPEALQAVLERLGAQLTPLGLS